jgi:fibronectin type 3 domain-containing protein
LDRTAVSGKAYAYTVRAYYGAALSWFDTVGKGVRYLSLPVPTAKAATGSVALSWTKSSGASGYYVYRKTGSGSWVKIATITGDTKLSYTDKNVVKGTKYTYTVRAYYGNYLSSLSQTGASVTAK